MFNSTHSLSSHTYNAYEENAHYYAQCEIIKCRNVDLMSEI